MEARGSERRSTLDDAEMQIAHTYRTICKRKTEKINNIQEKSHWSRQIPIPNTAMYDTNEAKRGLEKV